VTIDLHTHTTCSDGTDPPAQLVGQAAAAGVTVLGLTDHDTTAGWADAIDALPAGMTLVPGVEISGVWEAEGRRTGVHVLGYLVDPDDPALSGALRAVRESRLWRGRTIVERLAADGVPIGWDAVARHAGAGTVGRPHVARALVEAGVVDSVAAAFAGPLHSSSPYYVHKADVPALTAISLVRGAGGVAALAHPLARRRGKVVSDDDIAALAAAGLVGLEVEHPDHTEEDRRHLDRLASDLDLVPLGSSDYHGANKPTGLAACTTAPAALAALVRAARRPVVTG
jgi:3',5'-nucleoside bisphosphate phosphatase